MTSGGDFLDDGKERKTHCNYIVVGIDIYITTAIAIDIAIYITTAIATDIATDIATAIYITTAIANIFIIIVIAIATFTACRCHCYLNDLEYSAKLLKIISEIKAETKIVRSITAGRAGKP